MYCDVVLIACHETSQFILCDTGSGDVQKSPISGLWSIGGNADEVKISTVSTTQCLADSNIHSSTEDTLTAPIHSPEVRSPPTVQVKIKLLPGHGWEELQ